MFETLTANSFNSWIGFAFERFCVKHSALLADIMGFGDDVLTAGPYFERQDIQFQIDLLYKRMDHVLTICEIKHMNKLIGTVVIPEMERKCKNIKIPHNHSLEKALIILW